MNILGKIYSHVIKASKVLSRKGLYDFLEKEFATIGDGKVLNIGSGGDIGKLLEKYSANVTSFDMDEARKPDIVGDICKHEFEEKFDVIVLSEVLEHIPEPHKALENIHSTLKDGGKLIMTTPFIFPMHDKPHDYFRYTRYGLEFLLRDFRDVKIEEKNSWAEAINVLAPRLVMEESVLARLLAPFCVLWAFVKLPFVLLLGKIIDTNFATTGYNTTAKK